MSDVPDTVAPPEGVAAIPLEVVETRVGAFGVSGSPDVSGYGGLVSPVMLPGASSRPYGGWFDDAADRLAALLGDDMLATLRGLPQRSIVLLHACCHNPTGVDLTRAQWTALIPVLAERELLPYVDIAYQGFGDGVGEDAFAIRAIADADLPCFVANSFSKSFSLYGERVGGLSVICVAGACVADPMPPADAGSWMARPTGCGCASSEGLGLPWVALALALRRGRRWVIPEE